MKDEHDLKMIGVETGRSENLKDEYSVNNMCFGITIHKNTNTKSLQVEITTLQEFMNGFLDSMDAARKNAHKRLSKEQIAAKDKSEEKRLNDNKPVDTSDWVKPDEETIRDELLKNLVLCEVFKENTTDSIIAHAKRDVLYSILHSHSPSNPQSLTEFMLPDNYETILHELDNPQKIYPYELVDKVYNGELEMDKMRETFKEWKEAQLKNIITVHKETRTIKTNPS